MMTADVLEATLPWAASWAARGLKCVWYGGEPLLNLGLIEETMPRWEAFFRNAKKELGWSITTNGTLLDERARRVLDAHKVDVLMSLDGPPELHNQSRTYYGGKPSFDDIPIAEILAWKPGIEIAWQLDPRWKAEPRHVEEMIDRGFHKINFNVNWLIEWPAQRRLDLMEFMRYIARTCLQSRRGERPGRELHCNWMGKLDEALIKTGKPAQPCGTGLHMLALTPEGYLYPSQEMAFTAFEPGRAPGTDLYYRVGDVNKSPVIDQERLREVSSIQNSQMRTPEGFSCSNCVANPVSFGGCHCRYIGQNGTDPADRFSIALGWCQSMQSTMTGLLQGAMIEKYVGIKLAPKPVAPIEIDVKKPEPVFEEAGRMDFVAEGGNHVLG
jgi:radical SAM protein with 4Fe4S-binding SPASM domain